MQQYTSEEEFFKNRRQNISVDFEGTKKVGNISVYWYEEPKGEDNVRLPREWWVDYRVGDGDWIRMKKYITDFYGLERNTFNAVRPSSAITCDAIRISVLPQVGYCMGIHEIQIGFEE